MKLILEYDIGGGYECGSYPQTICIEYESAEALICDFEKALLEARTKWETGDFRADEFKFCDVEFNVTNFLHTEDGYVRRRPGIAFELPEIFELNEWFDRRLTERR